MYCFIKQYVKGRHIGNNIGYSLNTAVKECSLRVHFFTYVL